MGVYVSPSDCKDPALKVTESHCGIADTNVKTALLAKAITPTELAALTLPNPQLTLLGMYYALGQAALEASREGSDVMMGKHQAYMKMARDFAAQISRSALGIPDAADGSPPEFGTFEIERG